MFDAVEIELMDPDRDRDGSKAGTKLDGASRRYLGRGGVEAGTGGSRDPLRAEMSLRSPDLHPPITPTAALTAL